MKNMTINITNKFWRWAIIVIMIASVVLLYPVSKILSAMQLMFCILSGIYWRNRIKDEKQIREYAFDREESK